MPRWEIPTYGRLWQSIGTVLLDATTSAARNIRSQQLSQVFLQKRIDVHSSRKTSATSLCATGRRNVQPYCPCSFHLLPGHGELSDLVRKHALVRDGIQKHAPILDGLEFAIACLVSQILGTASFSWTQRNSTSLLDLPAEIHAIIHKALFAGFKFEVCIHLPHDTVLRRSTSLALLSTCRLIHNEAVPYLSAQSTVWHEL